MHVMNSFEEILAAVKEYCRQKLVAAAYNAFIDRIEPVSFDGVTALLATTSEFLVGIIEKRYLGILEEAFREIMGFKVTVVITVPEKKEEPVETPPPVTETTRAEPVLNSRVGNYSLTFDNFIVGSTNKFAHAAALAVATNPADTYNPLFIWGDSGLGKTHLLHAIRTEILHNHPDYDILLVDGETFTNEIITAIQNGTTAQLHDKYRAADVLLVDDIQFIAGKVSTQEEFFHTFNALYNAGKQIVLVSDRTPKEIKSLDDRLRSRFVMGLIADIQPPDFEMRVAIVRRKADLLGLDLSDDVAEYIANRLKTNIRQLEGAVKKLNAYRLLENIRPTIGAAQNAIKDILNELQPVPVTVDKIISEVARTYNTTPDMIRGTSRVANVAAARNVSMYIIREITGMSLKDIGSEFSGRDHSTVSYAIRTIVERMEEDMHLEETVEDIIKNVRT